MMSPWMFLRSATLSSGLTTTGTTVGCWAPSPAVGFEDVVESPMVASVRCQVLLWSGTSGNVKRIRSGRGVPWREKLQISDIGPAQPTNQPDPRF